MAHGKFHSSHAIKIGRIKLPLAAGPAVHRLSQQTAKQFDHRIKHRNMRNSTCITAFFDQVSQIGINNAHQQDAGIAINAIDHRIDMRIAAHQCPHMFGCPYIGELRKAGARHLMHRFAGGIGYQM